MQAETYLNLQVLRAKRIIIGGRAAFYIGLAMITIFTPLMVCFQICDYSWYGSNCYVNTGFLVGVIFGAMAAYLGLLFLIMMSVSLKSCKHVWFTCRLSDDILRQQVITAVEREMIVISPAMIVILSKNNFAIVSQDPNNQLFRGPGRTNLITPWQKHQLMMAQLAMGQGNAVGYVPGQMMPNMQGQPFMTTQVYPPNMNSNLGGDQPQIAYETIPVPAGAPNMPQVFQMPMHLPQMEPMGQMTQTGQQPSQAQPNIQFEAMQVM